MDLWPIIGIILAVVTFPGTAELLLLTIGGLLPRRREGNFIQNLVSSEKKLVVIVPAHNEENHIDKVLSSLIHAEGNYDVVVVADHCTDTTVERAKKWKVRIIESKEPTKKGKQFALKKALGELLQDNYDVYAVIDADSTISPNFSAEILRLVEGDFPGVQVLYGIEFSKKASKSIQAKLSQYAYLSYNCFRPLARTNLGFSSGIMGNGFALTRKTLLAVPFHTEESSIADIIYHLRLVATERKVVFTYRTKVFSEIDNKKIAIPRSAEWEMAKILLPIRMMPTFLKGIFKGNFLLIEPMLDLMLLPLSYHTILLLILLGIPYAPTQYYAVFGLIIMLAHLIAVFITVSGSIKER